MNAKIDTLGPFLDTMAGIVVEPYKTFFARLYAAGRVTDAELTALRAASEDKVVRLSSLMEKALEDATTGEIAGSRQQRSSK